ncbi:MAG: hypothetical protein JW955_16165 [Sedimentisphaerales bacterium]|nr:hypothetical protein [Sedimentisphaerales bacterium]
MSKKLYYVAMILALVWSLSAAFGQPPAGTPGKGKALFEYYYDIGSGTAVSDLTSAAKYPDSPDYYEWNDSFFAPPGVSGGGGIRNNYGIRGRAYVWPPETGEYTFWVAGDDGCELWLSTDDNPANATRIANITGWTPAQDWSNTAGGSTDSNAMKSKAISLKAGQKYYIQGLMKEAGGGESIGAAWAGPGIGGGATLIVGKYLSAWIRDPEPMFTAREPDPADGATGVLIPMLQWTGGATATFHDVYFGETPDPPLYKRISAAASLLYYPIPLEPGKVYYWKVNEIESDRKTVHEGTVWSFTMAPLAAFGPTPRNGDKWIDPATDLEWQPGVDAMAHDVYFSTDRDLVAARDASVKVGDKQIVPLLELPALQPGTTYYWLVDEYDSIDVLHEGEVWSFTTNVPGTGGIKAEYFNNISLIGAPFLTQIETSIDHTWADGTGPTAGVTDNFSIRWTADLEIAVPDTYTFIPNTDDGVRLYLNDQLIVDSWIGKSASDTPSNPMWLDVGIYSLRMDYYEATGGASAQLYWEGKTLARELLQAGPLQPPVRAKPINPKDNDVNVPQNITLMWSTGEKAATHSIYFGDDEAAVAAADASVFKGSVPLETNTFSPGALEWNKTYYWRVDEVNGAESDSPWTGGVWSFTTADFIVVDDFESYTDDVENRIFQTWIDGWGYTEPAPGDPGNGTGSTVGYANEPFSEHGTVHGGGSSMPFAYNNADSPNYSETGRTFASPQNWTINGVDTLCLYVQGYPQPTSTAVTETGGKMSLTGGGADIWGASDEFTYAYKTLNGDGTIIARVVNNGTGSNAWAKGGVMIRDSLNGDSASAQMVLTGGDGNGATFQNRATAGLDMGANDATSNITSTAIIAPPYWVKIERNLDTFTGYVSPDGVGWTMIGSAEVVMTAPVHIGICVTSHASTEQRTFEFDNIKTTGSVTGQWQGAVIDSPQYNSAQDLYVAITDSSNKTAVVTDATAVNAETWTQVLMPLSSFTGVNMTKVTKMYIGVGNRTTPVADGTGMLFIDDIRVIKP